MSSHHELDELDGLIVRERRELRDAEHKAAVATNVARRWERRQRWLSVCLCGGALLVVAGIVTGFVRKYTPVDLTEPMTVLLVVGMLTTIVSGVLLGVSHFSNEDYSRGRSRQEIADALTFAAEARLDDVSHLVVRRQELESRTTQ